MRKWITLLMTLLVGCGSYANANTGQVSFEAGYRRDNLSWRSNYPSNNPFFSTSTRFKDLDIFQLGLEGRTTLGCNFYIRGNAYWGWILDGDYNRSISTYFSPDYSSSGYNDPNLKIGLSDHRTTVIDDKYVFGILGGVGYPFYFCDCSLILAPVIGYSYDEQNIRVDDEGFNLTESDGCVFAASTGQHRCCRETFISRWYGGFVGLDFNYRPWNECFNVYAEVEYHFGHFRGKRSHNPEVNYEQRNPSSKNATGWAFEIGADYDLSECWAVGLNVRFQGWNASRHHHYNSDDSDYGCCNNDRLRTKAKWDSYAVNLTFGRDF